MKAIPAILLLLLLSACLPEEPTWDTCWQSGKKVVPDQERERGWSCKRR